MSISFKEFNSAVNSKILKNDNGKFKNHEKFDSICKLNLMLYLDKKYNFSISFEQIEKIESLKDLNKLIK